MTTSPLAQLDLLGRTARPVLIVGAGPTGLTLAIELACAGVPYRIIEAASEPQAGSRGKGLQPRTLEVFGDLGIIDRVLDAGRMAMPIWSTAPDGQVTRGGTVPDSMTNRPDVPYPASVVTPQWRVEEALRLRLAELGGSVEFGVTLTSLEQSADSVSAVLTRGSDKETVTAAWVVGCDGGHSSTRKLAGLLFEGDTLEDVRMIVADVSVDGLDRDAWHLWRHPDGFMALCPLPSTGLFQYQAGIAPGQNPDLSRENLQAILDRRTGRTDVHLDDPAWVSLWRANIRLVDHYREGRVVLAGDAAHIHSPAGGQGMNTGIQDAHNLSWKLAAVTHGADPALIDTYEAERRPVAEGVLALSNARLAQTLQQNDIPTRRDADTTQLGVNYRGSTLAHDDRDDTAALRAGDRAPDASGLIRCEGERRLFDLIGGGRFTLLRFGTWASAEPVPLRLRILDVVEKLTGPHDVIDGGGYLASAYAPTDRTLVLIRPDGYIGLISDDGDLQEVQGYLSGVGQPQES